jgi:CHAT domain
MSYLDFDLVIESRGDHMVSRVESSPFGRAQTRFALSFSDAELDRFIRTIGHPRAAGRRLAPGQTHGQTRAEGHDVSMDTRAFGRALFDAVFAGPVGATFQRSLDEAAHQHRGLRVRLQLDDALREVPWEFLYAEALGRYLVLSVDTPLVRFIDLPQLVEPLAMEPPLRVLVVVPDPEGVPGLDAAGEIARLEDATAQLRADGLLELHRQGKATFDQLRRRLKAHAGAPAYHVLHFIGHGGFESTTGQGSLVFQDDQGRVRKVTGHDLGMILHDHTTLRLAVLNACEGARTNRADPFGGVAQSLVRQGIPAVVAMQFEVTDGSAKVFADEFYTALADGRPVDAATSEARRAIFTSDNAVEWATPVLYLRSPDGSLFDVSARPSPRAHPQPASASGRVAPRYAVGTPVVSPQDFFGRYHEVRRLLAKLRTPPLQNAAIVGKKRSGKTSLLRHLPALCAAPRQQLRPRQQEYVLDGFEGHRWVHADFQDPRLRTRRGFFDHVLTQLGGQRPEQEIDLGTFYELVCERLNRPTVILMDEVGVLLSRLTEEYDDGFWDAMRSLASSEAGANLAFVLATHAPPHLLAAANSYTSPFFNIIGYTATLGPFTEDEADELIRSGPQPFPEGEVAWIKQRSGGWPLLLQILCSELATALEEGEPLVDLHARVEGQLEPHGHLLAGGGAP